MHPRLEENVNAEKIKEKIKNLLSFLKINAFVCHRKDEEIGHGRINHGNEEMKSYSPRLAQHLSFSHLVSFVQ